MFVGMIVRVSTEALFISALNLQSVAYKTRFIDNFQSRLIIRALLNRPLFFIKNEELRYIFMI